MRLPFLHKPSGAYDRQEIMRRAWAYACNTVARCADMKMPATLRACFTDALRRVWDEARGARALMIWQAEQAAADEAAKLLDARTQEIRRLHQARTAADGIDSTRIYLAEVRAIETRLAALNA